jgi:hypothetical protein
MATLTPSHGARFLFDRIDASEEAPRYSVEIHAPEGTYRGEARLAPEGVTLSFEGAEPAAWAIEQARGFLRTISKNGRADADWPRRVLRWREKR